MQNERRKGFEYSATLHVVLLLLAIFGLPSFLRKDPPPEPAAITVELLPITGITNVKPVDSNEAPKPEPKTAPKPAEETKKPSDAKKDSPPVKTAQAAPPPPKDAVAPPDKKKEEKEPEKPEKETEKEPNKAKVDDLEAVLKAVKDTAKKEKKSEQAEVAKKEESGAQSKSISNKYDPGQPLSLSEKDAIMGQLARCWSPPAGAKNAHELIVVINAEFNIDGSFISAVIADESKSRYNSDSFFRAAAESALRAVRQCSPLKNLPQDKYATWKSMELHFDPRDMLL